MEWKQWRCAPPIHDWLTNEPNRPPSRIKTCQCGLANSLTSTRQSRPQCTHARARFCAQFVRIYCVCVCDVYLDALTRHIDGTHTLVISVALMYCSPYVFDSIYNCYILPPLYLTIIAAHLKRCAPMSVYVSRCAYICVYVPPTPHHSTYEYGQIDHLQQIQFLPNSC